MAGSLTTFTKSPSLNHQFSEGESGLWKFGFFKQLHLIWQMLFKFPKIKNKICIYIFFNLYDDNFLYFLHFLLLYNLKFYYFKLYDDNFS